MTYNPNHKARKAASIARKINQIVAAHGADNPTTPELNAKIKAQLNRYFQMVNDAYEGEKPAMHRAFDAEIRRLGA